MEEEFLTPQDISKKGEQYLTVNELAEYIKRSKPAIRMLTMRREIPFRKVAGRLVFIKSEVDEWINMSKGIGIDEIRGKGK